MIVNRDVRFDDKRRERIFTIPVKAGDTPTMIQTKLINAVNSDPKAMVTLAEVDTTNHNGFKVTAKKAGDDFTVVCGGILANADVLERQNVVHAGTAGVIPGYLAGLTTVVVANDKGNGLPAQVRSLETELSPMDGNGPLTTTLSRLYTVPSVVENGILYNGHILKGYVANDNALIPKANFRLELDIAIPSTLYGAGATGAVLTAIIAAFNLPLIETK